MLYLELVNWAGNDIDKSIDLNEIKLKYQLQDIPIPLEHKETSSIQKHRKSLEDILESLNLKTELKILITSGSKKRSLTDHKVKFITEALNNKYTLNEIVSFPNIGRLSVSMLLSRHKDA